MLLQLNVALSLLHLGIARHQMLLLLLLLLLVVVVVEYHLTIGYSNISIVAHRGRFVVLEQRPGLLLLLLLLHPRLIQVIRVDVVAG